MKRILLMFIVTLLVLTSCSKDGTTDEVVTTDPETPIQEVEEEVVEEVVEEPKEEPKPELDPEPEDELTPEVEEEIELVKVNDFFNQQPVIIYKTGLPYIETFDVPVGFYIIKDNRLNYYEISDEVFGKVEDFVYHKTSEKEDEYEEKGLLEISELYEMSDEEIIDYVETTDNYKLKYEDRKYVIALITQEVLKETHLYYTYMDHAHGNPDNELVEFTTKINLTSEGDSELGYRGKAPEEQREFNINKLRYNHENAYYKLTGLNSTKGFVRVKANQRLINDPEAVVQTQSEIESILKNE